MVGCEDKEETALETLKGFEEELDWLLTVLEGSENAGSTATQFGPEDFPGEYDSFPGAAPDDSAPFALPAASEVRPGYFTDLMTAAAEPPQASADTAAAGPEVGEASVSGQTSSCASTATHAEEAKSVGKRTRSAQDPGSRRPRKAFKEGEARNPVGRPRVDPAKTYFRHLRRYSSVLLAGEEEAAGKPAGSASEV